MNKILFLILFIIVCTPGVAQDDPIFTDRPNVTDAVSLITPGTFQVELGYLNTKYDFSGNSSTAITAPNLSLKYGLFNWLELRLLTNYGIIKYDIDPLSFEDKGLTPITFSPKFGLTKQNGAIPKMALVTNFTFPDTGNESFQVSELNYGFRYLFEYGFDKFTWTNSVGTDWPKGTEQLWSYTTVGGYAFTDKLGGYVEFYGYLNQDFNNFDIGLTYLINNNFQVDAIYGHTIGGTSGRTLGFGVAWKTGGKKVTN